MKKITQLFWIAISALSFSMPITALAQVCTVDSQYTSPGIYPSDTLPDMMEGSGYSAVVQFVFPSDTNVSGFTLNFDSFVVAGVANIPAGINWECNANHPTCHYICNPPALTRGCVTVYGTPTAASPGYPAYDSIVVTGVAYVTVPFVGVQSFPQDIPVYYRTQGIIAVEAAMNVALDVQVLEGNYAQPSVVRYHLATAASVTVEVTDLLGHRLWVRESQFEAAGQHDVALATHGLASGIYLVRVTVNEGEAAGTQKFVVRN